MIESKNIKYDLVTLTPDGERLYLRDVTTDLSWEEQPGELAVRLTATLRNIRRKDKWLHQLLPLGGKMYLYADWGIGAQEIFRGTIFRADYQNDGAGSFTITAYDPLIYLSKSEDDRYYPAGTTGKTILQDIAKSWQIPLGQVDGPNVALSKQVFRAQRISQMSDSVLKESKKRGDDGYIIRASLDKIDIVKSGQNSPVYFFTEENVSNISDQQNIENLVTRVKIVGTANDNARSPVIAQIDGKTEFGILQQIVNQDSYDTPAAAKQGAQDILDEQGKPENLRQFEAPDLPFLRRGDRIHIQAGTLNGYYTIAGITHNATKQTMSIEVDG